MHHDLPRTETTLVRAHGLAALAAVLYVVLLGVVIALKFHWPDFLGGEAAWTWGRLRYGHTQGIVFGWLGNAFLAFLYHAVPRLAGRSVTSRGLGWLLFALWNFAVVVPGHILVQLGHSQPLEWAESRSSPTCSS
jgi:cbb3-type cytochrome oxidase subunit 1